MEHEVVIIGSGMAGATAALFSARLGRRTLCLGEGLPGGQLLSVSRIEDYPGFPAGVSGFELCPAVQEQALDAGAEFRTGVVQALEHDGSGWTLQTESGQISARAVIVASGSRPRALGVAGEERLVGRGVSHCASCDGPLHRDGAVCVIGGGDSALQEVLELTEHVPSVLLVHRGPALRGQESYRQRVLASDRIEIRLGAVVTEILGDHRVSGLRLRDVAGGAEEEIAVTGVFPCIGSEGRTAFLAAVLETDENGRLLTDASMRTELPGLLAAGDVRAESVAHAVAVAGDGATAAAVAHRYLEDGAWRSPTAIAAGR